jgi:hypothetical protein
VWRIALVSSLSQLSLYAPIEYSVFTQLMAIVLGVVISISPERGRTHFFNSYG